MANIISFEMKIRGSKSNCKEMMSEENLPFERWVLAENGDDNNYLIHLQGECNWDITGQIVFPRDEESLAEKAKRLSLEVEVFGYDPYDPDYDIEHFHYKNAECLKEYNMPSYLPEDIFDDYEFTDEDKKKYQYIEENEAYILLDEFKEEYEYDEANGKMLLIFDMDC